MNHSRVIKDLKERFLNDMRIAIFRVENTCSIGMPDLIILVPGKTIYIEIKNIEDVLNTSQIVWWKKALHLKQECYIMLYTYSDLYKEYKYGLHKPNSVKKRDWGDMLWTNEDGSKKIIDILLHTQEKDHDELV